ncbi:MAG: ABC transporter permease subunit [Microthrixaceae bacterium]|nr:iron ABC transporter permease [Microthrixaceae bacterium]MCO5313766.1 ABC transporter permease subunit [Microthrixaceae bacterium]
MTWRRAVLGVGAVLWALAYGWPLVAVMGRSITGVAGREGLGLATWSVLWDERTLRLFAITFAQSAASVVVVMALGVPMGWALARLSFRGSSVVSAVVMVPFVLPTLTVASAVLAVVGGLPDADGARFALVVVAHVCLNLGLMVRAVAAAVAAVPASIEDSARSLGHRPLRAVRATTLRMIAPQIADAALLVAMFCLTSFGVIVGLGSARVSTVEVEVWFLSTRSLDLASAAVLVVAQLAIVLAIVALQARVGAQRRTRVGMGVGAVRRRPVRGRGDRSLAAFTVLATAVFAGGPPLALVLRSLHTARGWGLGNYRALFGAGQHRPDRSIPALATTILGPGDAGGAISASVLGAVLGAVLALALAAPLVVSAGRDDSVGRFVDRLLIVPMSISAATLGLGFLLAYSGAWIDLRGTWIAVPLVQAATAAPIAARLLLGGVRSVDRQPFEAAAVLGAGRLRRGLRIGVPLLGRPVAVAAGFAFAMAIGEFGATVFLARPDRPTIPILISRLLGRAGTGNFGAAMALSCVLAAIVIGAVALVDRRGRGQLG